MQGTVALRDRGMGTDLHLLARDARISQATAYRYLHEVLAAGRQDGWAFAALDGTLIESTRSSAKSAAGHVLWYSGKRHAHGGNIQVVTDPTGLPIWTSPVEPGSIQDITAARAHVLPFLYPAAANGVPTLADKGYTGAGIGIHVPLKGRNLETGNRATNQVITALRAPAERANALLKSTWKALRRVTVGPSRIGDIVAAALVLLTAQRGR